MTTRAATPRFIWILFLVVAVCGAAIRIVDTAAWRGTGPDEMMYRRYVNFMDGYDGVVGVLPSDAHVQKTKSGGLVAFRVKISSTGMLAMPEIVDFYRDTQKNPNTLCELPPLRFGYLYPAWLWKRAQFGNQPPLAPTEMRTSSPNSDYAQDVDHRDPALASLHRITLAFGIGLMLVGGVAAWRMAGPVAGLGVLALLAADPLLIHLSQHAMIDGVFAFWATMAVWTTWECLRNPDRRGWLIAHVFVLAMMVMTKENAFFVYVGLAAAVLSNRWLHFGKVTPRFLAGSFLGGLLGLCTLVLLAGGVDGFVDVYRLFASKAQELSFVRQYGDGPWYRYLIDYIAINPLIVCLALGGVFSFLTKKKEIAFLAVFLASTYLLMCNIRYGINLRFASIWTFPLALIAFAVMSQFAAAFGRRQAVVTALMVIGLAAYELRQYRIFAMNPAMPLYELTTLDLLRPIQIVKD